MARIQIKSMNMEDSIFHQEAAAFTGHEVHVFFSGKGGSGTTFLAGTYACVLRNQMRLRVLLADMDLKWGGIESYIGVNSERSVFDLKPVLGELNETHIRHVVQTDSKSQIDVLLSPCTPFLDDSLNESEIDFLLTMLKKLYNIIVIDAGNELNPVCVSLLRHADRIHYVLTPDSPSLRRYSQMKSFLEQIELPIVKMSVILNRTGKTNEIQTKDLKGIQPMQIVGKVRSDFPGIQSCINLAIPIVSLIHDKNPPVVLKDILNLTQELFGRRSLNAR